MARIISTVSAAQHVLGAQEKLCLLSRSKLLDIVCAVQFYFGPYCVDFFSGGMSAVAGGRSIGPRAGTTWRCTSVSSTY